MKPIKELTPKEIDLIKQGVAKITFHSTIDGKVDFETKKIKDITASFIELDIGFRMWAGAYEGISRIDFEKGTFINEEVEKTYGRNGGYKVPEELRKEIKDRGYFLFSYTPQQ